MYWPIKLDFCRLLNERVFGKGDSQSLKNDKNGEKDYLRDESLSKGGKDKYFQIRPYKNWILIR